VVAGWGHQTYPAMEESAPRVWVLGSPWRDSEPKLVSGNPVVSDLS